VTESINPDAYGAKYVPPPTDLDIQLARWRTSEERFVNLLRTSATITEATMIKAALRDVRAEIARLEAILAHSERTSS